MVRKKKTLTLSKSTWTVISLILYLCMTSLQSCVLQLVSVCSRLALTLRTTVTDGNCVSLNSSKKKVYLQLLVIFRSSEIRFLLIRLYTDQQL